MFINVNNFMGLLNYCLFLVFMIVNFLAVHRKIDRIENTNLMMSILLRDMSHKEYEQTLQEMINESSGNLTNEKN